MAGRISEVRKYQLPSRSLVNFKKTFNTGSSKSESKFSAADGIPEARCNRHLESSRILVSETAFVMD